MTSAKHAWQTVARVSPPKRPAHQRVGDFAEIYSSLDPQTAREQASRCLQCPQPLCRTGCPLANRIPEWLALVAEGDFVAAAALSASTSNMPEICSRVCPQERLCEGMCVLNARSEPVGIGALERFVQEYAFARGVVHGCPTPRNGLRVSIVGSGPAGLACADELAKRGYAVTVFESQAAPGGLLRYGIPAFKLEKWVVDRRINILRQRGIVFRLNVAVGRDVSLRELQRASHAIFLGVGAQTPKPLKIPGAELDGVFQALPFLIQKNLPGCDVADGMVAQGKRVVVLGGGDTAMDCLRTALRCGAREAVCLYRRDFENMPGSRKEFANAVEEGAQFEFLVDAIALEGDATGRLAQVRCIRMELGATDAAGRRTPRPVSGSQFVVPADVVLVAYGFDPAPLSRDSGWGDLAVNDWGALQVDGDQMTSMPGVFSGGDSVRGPSLVVHAVRDGRRAALGIDRYLAQTVANRQPSACAT